jgi:branched-subunit amino acid ABC-type transport system permease component
VSSAYKDVIAFGIMLAVLVLMPGGLVGRSSVERV